MHPLVANTCKGSLRLFSQIRRNGVVLQTRSFISTDSSDQTGNGSSNAGINGSIMGTIPIGGIGIGVEQYAEVRGTHSSCHVYVPDN